MVVTLEVHNWYSNCCYNCKLLNSLLFPVSCCHITTWHPFLNSLPTIHADRFSSGVSLNLGVWVERLLLSLYLPFFSTFPATVCQSLPHVKPLSHSLLLISAVWVERLALSLSLRFADLSYPSSAVSATCHTISRSFLHHSLFSSYSNIFWKYLEYLNSKQKDVLMRMCC